MDDQPLVRVTPIEGMPAPHPFDSKKQIAKDGEDMAYCTQVKRMERRKQVTISAIEVKAPKKKPGKGHQKKAKTVDSDPDHQEKPTSTES